MNFPRHVLWKAIDGREFIIDTLALGIKNQEQLLAHVDKLRQEIGCEKPDFVHVAGDIGAFEGVNTDDLPENERKLVVEAIANSIQKPDPKKQN